MRRAAAHLADIAHLAGIAIAIAIAIALLAALAPAAAFATTGNVTPPAEIPCGRVESGVIHIDGLLEDWAEVPPLLIAGAGDDFSLAVKCNYDDRSLYLVADVQDDQLVRSRRGAAVGGHVKKERLPVARGGRRFPTEDGVEIVFEEGGHLARLRVLPGDAEHKVARALSWDPARASHVEEADSLQPSGWAVEVRVPLDEVPGWFSGAPQIRLAVAAHDVDPGRKPRVIATATLATGRLNVVAFGEAGQQLEAFLRDRKLVDQDIRFNEVGRGTGRVVLAKATLAFISDEFTYTELPVESPADILEIRLCDLAGDEADSALLRYRERGAAGSSREILAAYRVTTSGLSRVFGVEVGKSQGANRLVTEVTLVKRGPATDILVEALPAIGWNSGSYHEAPAQDVAPIPLPWGKENKSRFRFHGEEYLQVQ